MKHAAELPKVLEAKSFVQLPKVFVYFLYFPHIINTIVSTNILWSLNCFVGHKIHCSQIRPHKELRCSQEEKYTGKSLWLCLCYSCIFSISFSSRTVSLYTSCMDWNDYFYNDTHTSIFFCFYFREYFQLSHRLCWARCLGRCQGLQAEMGRRWGAQY